MKLPTLLFTFIFVYALPNVEEERSKMDQITETAKTYFKRASIFCKDTFNNASLLVHRCLMDLMNRFKSLRERGEVKIEEHKEDLNEFEELTEEKMKELLKQFYEKMGAGEEFEASGPEEKGEESEKIEGSERSEV